MFWGYVEVIVWEGVEVLEIVVVGSVKVVYLVEY